MLLSPRGSLAIQHQLRFLLYLILYMHSLLDRLYKTKLQLIAVLSTVGGIGVLVLAHWSDSTSAPSWLAAVPLAEIGSTLFGTGLLAVFFEYVDRKHGDQRTDERVRAAVRKEAPAIRDAVLDSFAFDPAALKSIASNQTLDRIAANAIGLRLEDQALAKDVYTDLRDQVIRAPERWQDLRVSVHFAPHEDTVAADRPMFVATIRREYKVTPAVHSLRFVSTGDLQEYRELLRDPTVAGQWYFQPKEQFDADDRQVFELVQFRVNNTDRPIRRSQRRGSQTYTVSLGKAATAGEAVTVSYTYRALVQQHGHLLYLDVPRPTKGIEVQFNYADAGICYVNTLDFMASAEQPLVQTSPADVPAKSVTVRFDGWLFPRSGVAFVWVLEDELAGARPTPSP